MKMIKQLLSWFVVGLLFVATSWALTRAPLFRVHDYIHAARVAEMTRAFEAGHIPPRWSDSFGFGYGMPLFNFYAPLPTYIGSLMYWLGFSIASVVKMQFWLPSLLSLIGAYLLGRKLWGHMAGLITAAGFGLFPYRAVNLFVRGAVSESWGMMTYPWILYGLVLMVEKHRWGWLVTYGALVALMLSHNLSALMFMPVSVVFGAGWLLQAWATDEAPSTLRERVVTISQFAGTYLLAVLTAGFYLFPAYAEKGYTQIESILSGYFHYGQHFLFIRQFFKPAWGYSGSTWGPEDGIAFFLGYGQIFLLVIAGMMAVGMLVGLLRSWYQSRRVDQLPHLSALFTVFLILALFGVSVGMSLGRSQPLWDALPWLSFLQFPWRWLSVAGLFIGLAGGWAIAYAPRFAKGLLFVVGLGLLVLNAQYFKPESYLERNEDFYYTDQHNIRREMSGILPDYIPSYLEHDRTPPTTFVAAEPTAELNVIDRKPHQALVSVASSEPTTVSVAIADFPGWQTEIDGQRVSHQQTEIGTIAVSVPAGSHMLGVRFGRTPIRLYSELLSLGALIITGAIITKQTYDQKRS